MPGADVYIISYDLLENYEKTFSLVKDDIKTLIVDECQNIKNHTAARSRAAMDFSRYCKFVLGLSGTPIKNNAGEFFTMLNMINPERFTDYAPFVRKYVDHTETQYGFKMGGLSDIDSFKADTSDIIIRRTRSEVLPELPLVDRVFHHVELDAKLNAAYREALMELDELMMKDGEMATKIAIMTKLRKITGVSKVTECIDLVTDHLLSTDRKITVFLHHKTANYLLVNRLNQWLASGGYAPCLNLTSELSAEARAKVVSDFALPENKVLIASTLAAGEGLNLQFCSDCIIMERQWNPANEEQVEGRFARIGQLANKITATYMLASETIDEYFTELVEQKRSYVANALDGKEMIWSENNLMKELAEVLVSKGRKKWRL
jgi:SNF2 family DNA or RNA helicase